MTGSHILFVMLCGGLLLAAALHDLIARTIPSLLPVLLAGAGLFAHLAMGDAAVALLAGALVFFLAELCWLIGWLGGGDVKLLGAGAFTLPAARVPGFVFDVAIAGGLLALVYLFVRLVLVHGPCRPVLAPASLPRRAWRAELWRLHRGAPLPYGVAIAAAAAFVLLQGGAP